MKNLFAKEAILLLLILLYSFSSIGQKAKTYELDEIDISTSRVKSTMSETFKSVIIITKNDIAQMPVQNLEDVLEYFAGIDIRQRGIYGVQSDISIRGGSFEQTLILLNGVKVSDPQTAHHNMNLPIPLDQIERIEILKGPGARVYGQNAFAGAINIITKTSDRKSIHISTAIGEHKYNKESLSLSFPINKYHQNLTYSTSGSAGYKLNTDFRNHQLFYQATLNNVFNVNMGYVDKSFGANGFYTNLFPWQWEHTKTSFINLAWKGKSKINFEPKLHYRNNQDEFLLKRDTPSFYMNQHTTHIFGADFNAEFSSQIGKTSVGGDSRSEYIYSSSLGNHNRTNLGLFVEHKFIFKKLVVSPGAYANWNSSNDFSIFPGIDAGYQLGAFAEIFANMGKTYRTPSFTELYYNSPANIGNADLKAEEATSFELGYRYKKEKYSFSITGFRRNATNLIDWVRKSDTLAWKVVNLTRVNTTGLEAELKLFPQKIFNKNTFLQGVYINYTYLDANQLTSEYLSKNVLDYLQHQLIASVFYHISPKLHQSWKIRFEDRIGYEAHTLFDSRISYNTEKTRFYVEASNLFGITYYEFGGLEMPGRWIRLGVDIKLNLKINKKKSQPFESG